MRLLLCLTFLALTVAVHFSTGIAQAADPREDWRSACDDAYQRGSDAHENCMNRVRLRSISRERANACDRDFDPGTRENNLCLSGIESGRINSCDQRFRRGSPENTRCLDDTLPEEVSPRHVDFCERRYGHDPDLIHRCITETKRGCLAENEVEQRPAGSRGSDGEVCLYSCSQMRSLYNSSVLQCARYPTTINCQSRDHNRNELKRCCTGGLDVCE